MSRAQASSPRCLTMNDSLADWEEGGLPSPDELTPLSQSLISPALACAFSITPPPSPDSCPAADVQSASQSNSDSLPRLHRVTQPTVSMTDTEHVGIEAAVSYGDDLILPGRGSAENPETSGPEAIADQNAQPGPQGLQVQGISAGAFAAAPLQHGSSPMCSPDRKVGGVSGIADGFSPLIPPYDRRPENSCGAGVTFPGPSDSSRDGGAAAARKLVRVGENEEADSGSATENTLDEQTARTLKRPRLVWTQQLHKRFVDAVAHLGIKHAVPKTIMHLMNVDGLTRENVASHLQKYRLYLKRMQGLSNDGPSASDQLFASSPVPPSLAPSAHFLSSQRRDEVFPLPFRGPLVSVPLPGLVGHGHLPSSSSHSSRFTGFDPYAFNTLPRTAPQRSISGDNRERVGDVPNQQPSSPPPQILTLFPTGSF